MDADASEKMMRFIDLCDTFHLPVVNLVDNPGFLIGIDAERAGTVRLGSRAPLAMYQSSADWGSLPVEGGVQAACERDIESAPDPAARRLELGDMMENYRSPLRTAEAFGIEEIIDPRDTRPLLCDWIELAYRITATQTGPKKRTIQN